MGTDIGKTDRRINRTRKQLRKALLELVLERGYNTITVEDITDRADLGRTTFYLHYRDKEELLIESLEAIAEELKNEVEQLANTMTEGSTLKSKPVGVVFRHVEENRDLYRVILKGEGSSTAANRIRDIIQEAAVEYFNRHMSGFVSEPPKVAGDVIAGYFASAMLGFIMFWLDKEMPISGEEAADQFMELYFLGAAKALNLTIDL